MQHSFEFRLSEPILKLRPPEDLKNTLIHEMIHAYIFLKRIPGAGNDGHGPPFKAIMKQINESTVPDFHRPAEGYKITVYHTMIDEVRHYQQHWWECERCEIPASTMCFLNWDYWCLKLYCQTANDMMKSVYDCARLFGAPADVRTSSKELQTANHRKQTVSQGKVQLATTPSVDITHIYAHVVVHILK